MAVSSQLTLTSFSLTRTISSLLLYAGRLEYGRSDGACQWPLTYASNIMMVNLTISNHGCILTTYINIISCDKELSVVYFCLVEDLSQQDLMVLVSVH